MFTIDEAIQARDYLLKIKIDHFLYQMETIECYRLEDYEEYYFDYIGCEDVNCNYCRIKFNKLVDYKVYGTQYIRMK